MKRVFNLVLTACLVAAARAGSAEPESALTIDPVQLDAKADSTVRTALRWLASRQSPTGAFAESEQEKAHPCAITAYALMAFMAGGQLPNEGEFGKNVSRGMQYLLDSIGAEGHIGNRNNGQYMYGHGIASIALGELYGQTKSASMRPKLEKVIKLIIASQNPQGGWRYRPVSTDADISVTVLQVVALRSAKNAGLDVPQRTIDQAVNYVRSCYRKESGAFAYQPGQPPGYARTAAAIYSLQVCGFYDDPMVKTGASYLLKEYRDNGMEWWSYGNFYAAPALYMQSGDAWATYYRKVKTSLLKRAVTKGEMTYWEQPEGERRVGQIYGTACATMILAMPNHYLPLYQR